MLTFEVERRADMMGTVYIVTIPDKDTARLKLDARDRAYIYGPTGSVADEILKLGQLAFRMEQQQKKEEAAHNFEG